jgi:UDP-N-acetyl-D-mannosaminuronic acid transferase (WecB/TagA/CpsF family)
MVTERRIQVHPLIGFQLFADGRQMGRFITGSKKTKEGTMSQTVMEKTAEHIAESARQASRATRAAADAIIEDGVGVARRAARKGGDAAEEFLNDTTERLQRHLVLTVATTFAVGLTAGALVGWMIKRR